MVDCNTRKKREPLVLKFLASITAVAFMLQFFSVMGCTVQFEPGENSNSNLNDNSNNSNDNSNSNGVCGNDFREGEEVCDGEDLFGQTCESLGYEGGTLDCLNDCSGFDTSDCEGVGSLCGNGIMEWGEECDGLDLGGAGGQGGNYGAGGGGGGSGGSVLLEAAEIINDGLVAANGGGGGAGGENVFYPVSESGENAGFSDVRAAGGTGYYGSGSTCSGIECYGGSGGNGGAGNGRGGQNAEDDVPNSGGGGGGAGYIVLKFENSIISGYCSPNSISEVEGLSVW